MRHNPNADDLYRGPHEDRTTAAHALAVLFLAAQDSLCEEPGDPFGDALEAIQFLLPEADFRILARMIERCPMHLCDAQICADDQVAECNDYRA